ncbi:hypothetical protein SALBM135S_07759 [Streptomyces alboniger]
MRPAAATASWGSRASSVFAAPRGAPPVKKAARSAAYARNRSSFFAERTSNCSCPSSATGSGAPAAPAGRCSSTTTQALEPPAPKELMTARSGSSRDEPSAPGRSCRSQGSRVCCTWNGVLSKSISGLRSAECSDGTRVRCRSWSRTFVSPAMPAAASRWPMLVLTEPTETTERSVPRAASVRPPKTSTSPAISIGSPSSVPVPWAST